MPSLATTCRHLGFQPCGIEQRLDKRGGRVALIHFRRELSAT